METTTDHPSCHSRTSIRNITAAHVSTDSVIGSLILVQVQFCCDKGNLVLEIFHKDLTIVNPGFSRFALFPQSSDVERELRTPSR